MAAFSSSSSFQHHHHPFQLLDSSSVFLQHSSSSSSSSLSTINFDQPNNALLFSLFYQCSDQVSPLCNNNEPPSVFSVANKNSIDNSSSVVTDKYHEHSHDQQQLTLLNPINTPSIDNTKKRKSKHSSSSPNSAQSKDMREVKGKKQKKVKDNCGEKKGGKEAPTGFIHVRARRGQATDSHSLAERVRRERISERMKLLQALVPGCDKVTGKALMLDEIINYVQSLQNQVEFLSMKLASVNPMLYDFGMDLESLMVRPDQSLSSLPSPFPASMQECNPTTSNTYPLLDNSANSLLLQHSQIPYALPQVERQVLWEVDEQRQKINNQSGINNTLFSFPLM